MAESTWFILNSGLGEAAENMACDEALLEASSSQRHPAVRFYGWEKPAATFGYFQRYADVSALTQLRPLIRRPTGGDWSCMTVTGPTACRFLPLTHGLALKAVESYQRIHEWVQAAFHDLGIATTLSPCCVREGPGQCFVGAEQFDLLHDGVKIAGAAQRRRKDGLLIQGSIQAGKTGVQRTAFERAFCEAGARQWRIRWQDFRPAPEFLPSTSVSSRREKYSRVHYN
jgi:lipoate-protein ligase A